MTKKCPEVLFPLFRTSALVASLLTGYYHRVYGGTCSGSNGTYLCQGGASFADPEIKLNSISNALSVTTQPGFGIYTDYYGDNAFSLTSSSGLTFTDNYVSSISGYRSGIYAKNLASGALSISTSGTVTGRGQNGISALNYYGTDLSISVNNVYGTLNGIATVNQGSGVLSISASGTVKGSNNVGISARNHGTDLSISANNVYGYYYGIRAKNFGSGALSISASGTVKASGGEGIIAINYGTDLSISANNVYGTLNGIFAKNFGSGSLCISASGTVTQTGSPSYSYDPSAGIYAFNSINGSNLTISANNVTADDNGIYAINLGSGALSISTSGTVTGSYGSGFSTLKSDNSASLLSSTSTTAIVTPSYPTVYTAGIYAYNSTNGTSLTISANSVTGKFGIWATNKGSGPTTINVNNVTGYYDAINVFSETPISITASGTIKSQKGNAIATYGAETTIHLLQGSTTTGNIQLDGYNDLNDTIYLAGTLNGSIAMEGGDDLILLSSTSALQGTADGGDGTDTIGFSNAGTISSTILDLSKYLNFENIGFYGGTNNLIGSWDISGYATHVYSGKLYVNGDLTTDSLTVEAGALLGGYGTINSDVIVYGTLSPGNSIGTMTVNGDVDFAAGSTFAVELDADGDSDMLVVNGGVSIHNATLAVSLERALYEDGDSWRILSATGGISGKFSDIDTDFTSYTITLKPVYSGGTMSMEIERTPYATFGETDNATAVGAALDTILPTAYGTMEDMMIAMDFSMNPTQLSQTLQTLSPEIYTSFIPAGFSVVQLFTDMTALRQMDARDGKVHDIGKNGEQLPLWSVWSRVFGQQQDRDAENGVSGDSLDTTGSVFGLDRAFGSILRGGLTLGYADGDLSWEDKNDSGSIKGKFFGIYGNADFDALYLHSRAGYTALDNSATRIITTSYLSGAESASFDSSIVGASLNGGYDFAIGPVLVGPTAAIDYMHLSQDGVTEIGVDGLAVHIDSESANSFTGTIGIRAHGVVTSGQWTFRPTAKVNYRHQFADDANKLGACFCDYPAAGFTVTGLESEDTTAADFGIITDYGDSISLFINAGAEFAGNEDARMISGGIAWNF